jgi:hypothetical protein
VLQAPNPWILDHLIPGDYTITEVDAGTEWIETVPASPVAVVAGGTASANVTNKYNPAKIIVDKVTDPSGSPQSFTFTPTGTGYTTPFNLTDAATPNDSGWLVPGIYSVAETVPAGWVMTGLSVSGAGDYTIDYVLCRATITLAAGETATVTFENTAPLVTRTQGFWATHLSLTHAVWFGGTIGGHTFTGIADKTIGTHMIESDCQLMAAFWANVAKTSLGVKRTSLDQARMQLLQQLVAAILNNAAFGSSPTGPISIAQAKTCFANLNATVKQLRDAASAMAAFNEGGDTGVFTPGVSANGKQAKDAACLAFWNSLP